MKKLSIGDIVSRAWDLSVKHWPVFILLSIIEGFLGFGFSGGRTATFIPGQDPSPEEVLEAINSMFTLTSGITSLISFLLMTYLSLITYRMLMNVLRTGAPYQEGALVETLKVDIAKFGFFLGVNILFGLAVGFGFVACIIPGIILSVRWLFTPVIAATEDVTLSEAFGLSWDITKGHFWELFLLGLVCIGIVIVGFCACCVGVIFAEVITNFITVLAYDYLSHDTADSEEVIIEKSY